jgi:hypothetical protein
MSIQQTQGYSKNACTSARKAAQSAAEARCASNEAAMVAYCTLAHALSIRDIVSYDSHVQKYEDKCNREAAAARIFEEDERNREAAAARKAAEVLRKAANVARIFEEDERNREDAAGAEDAIAQVNNRYK